jgi:hypothetical protein
MRELIRKPSTYFGIEPNGAPFIGPIETRAWKEVHALCFYDEIKGIDMETLNKAYEYKAGQFLPGNVQGN